VTDHLLSAQRARALDQISTAQGVIAGAAVDHRDSLQAVLARRGLELDADGITALKLRVARALGPAASVVLLDAEFAAAQALAAGALPGGTALAVPLEGQGYGDVAGVHTTAFLDGWSPVKARRLGAAAAKLLLPYRADVPDQAERQRGVAEWAVSGCREAGLALVLEPIVYRRDGEQTAGGERFEELVVRGATELAALEPDVLKLQYPGSVEGCRALDEACGRLIPWVLLGGGADPEVLERQIEDACRAGASGFIVGRTLFDAALVEDAGESQRALEAVCRPLLERLRTLAENFAQPWRARVGDLPIPAHGWFREG
jgi:tagatose 1,6-diphosphate aldolase